MLMPKPRTIKSATYVPSAERTDSGQNVQGDVTYVTFEECEHLMLGNPIMSFTVGAAGKCWECAREGRA